VSALDRLLSAWRVPGLTADQREAKVSTLADLLSIKHVGIALASKWLCFVNQQTYAIYDSRVSLAMRDLAIDGNRVFPIVARRSLKEKPAWRADSVARHPKRMAESYWSYLRVINRAKDLIGPHKGEQRGLYPAEVEMALFMLGDVWPDPQSRLPLRKFRLG